jgi:glycine dehydrogenase
VPAPLSALMGEAFVERHIGPDVTDVRRMLEVIGVESVDQLIDETVPESIRTRDPLDLPAPASETDVVAELAALVAEQPAMTSLIGTGYYGTITPPVIRRNVIENPAWYTAYTPYQPEISQGRLEALLNYQTVISELTGLPIANASLLDEATAAAEAMTMARRLSKVKGDRFFVHADVHPQTLAVLRTRAEPIDIELVVGDVDGFDDACFGALLSYPTSTGEIRDWTATIETVRAAGALAIVATDLLACVLLRAPGDIGADIAVGSSQRFGVPLGYGGPHAGFIAVRESAARALPGRLVGVSTDAAGRPALRLALQTREQHIRREKATSNICTAQVLLANIAGLYATWHGPDGLRRIAERVHGLTALLADHLRGNGAAVRHLAVFDTLVVDGVDADTVMATAVADGINLRRVAATAIGLSLDETTTLDIVDRVATAITGVGIDAAAADRGWWSIPEASTRRGELLPQAVFHAHHNEHAMLRYLRRLADRDLALDRTMIPLGSCTMKLNATTEM